MRLTGHHTSKLTRALLVTRETFVAVLNFLELFVLEFCQAWDTRTDRQLAMRSATYWREGRITRPSLYCCPAAVSLTAICRYNHQYQLTAGEQKGRTDGSCGACRRRRVSATSVSVRARRARRAVILCVCVGVDVVSRARPGPARLPGARLFPPPMRSDRPTLSRPLAVVDR